jgi:hypothetical protein
MRIGNKLLLLISKSTNDFYELNRDAFDYLHTELIERNKENI